MFNAKSQFTCVVVQNKTVNREESQFFLSLRSMFALSFQKIVYETRYAIFPLAFYTLNRRFGELNTYSFQRTHKCLTTTNNHHKNNPVESRNNLPLVYKRRFEVAKLFPAYAHGPHLHLHTEAFSTRDSLLI